MEHPENNQEYKGLAVNRGIEQPASVNPYLKAQRKAKRRTLSVAEFVEGILQGNVTILSQAVTLVESVKPEHQSIAQEVMKSAFRIRAILCGWASVGCGRREEYFDRCVWLA
jgi:LAO/AO transport system kinase